MTGKELRELARAVLAAQLVAEKVDSERVHAAVSVLSSPMDPDEEREAHRKYFADVNAAAPVIGAAGNIGKQFMAADFRE